jgi:hypothetical protein
MRASRPGLFDANVNGWLAGDHRSFFVRCLRGGDGPRAWLSDGYKPIDHRDTLMAVFDGIRAAGRDVMIDSCDLTERRNIPITGRSASFTLRTGSKQMIYPFRSPPAAGRSERWNLRKRWRKVRPRQGA